MIPVICSIEAAQFEQGIPAGKLIAENQFLFARGAHFADGIVTGATRTKSQPTAQHHGENLFQCRRIRRTEAGATHHLYRWIAEMSHSAPQVARQRT